jgi:glycosyltransferase involved in cell wall biosynthesis
MPKQSIDILLPYWGEFALFKKTVDSVLAQTSPNWRLLIFDDCYPSDEAETYCASLNDSRVVYFRHKKNIGITRNFNYAVGAAKADYCALVGCDDILLPQYVETALKNIGSADFYQPGVEVIDGNDVTYLPLGDRIKRLLQPRKFSSPEKQAYTPARIWRLHYVTVTGSTSLPLSGRPPHLNGTHLTQNIK